MKKLISIDLDGVLNNYNGDYDENKLPEIKEGVKDFIHKLSNDFRIEIFTSRNLKETMLWLIENELIEYIENVSDIKNQYSTLILDDRAINFDGNLDNAYKKIINFKPYWK